jgi:hypothetical protein
MCLLVHCVLRTLCRKIYVGPELSAMHLLCRCWFLRWNSGQAAFERQPFPCCVDCHQNHSCPGHRSVQQKLLSLLMSPKTGSEIHLSSFLCLFFACTNRLISSVVSSLILTHFSSTQFDLSCCRVVPSPRVSSKLCFEVQVLVSPHYHCGGWVGLVGGGQEPPNPP